VLKQSKALDGFNSEEVRLFVGMLRRVHANVPGLILAPVGSRCGTNELLQLEGTGGRVEWSMVFARAFLNQIRDLYMWSSTQEFGGPLADGSPGAKP
jgi:hypothetical protein